MMAPGASLAIVSVAGIAGMVMAYWSGRTIGAAIQRDQYDAAAAGICPTCVATEDAARRLDTAGAVVSGVEWRGAEYPERKGGGDGHPVRDADSIVQTARARVRQLDFHRLRGPVA